MHTIGHKKFITFIEKNSKTIVKKWIQKTLQDETTGAFVDANTALMEAEASEMLEELELWLDVEEQKNEIGNWGAKHGAKLFKEGIPLCELSKAFASLRNSILENIETEYPYETPFDLQQLKDFVNNIVKYFDTAAYYILRGYTEEMNRKMKKEWKLEDEQTDIVFFKRSFYKRD